ncbi:inosine/uridine-preferring nucleoside hydrolase [Immersiella caudata]|uniref:Inosine/uridine-preferring nucleoside hydrolase n=1 Tax=Immersiella caudata TaxID=314043 RepID=A0AA39WA03_9PEZI|nr:inosine/uridine-preferring nucleoside hydrolase [Immersiella caudata]
MKLSGSATILLLEAILCLGHRKNIIIDTDIFSDVDDTGALMLAATSSSANLLAVNINYPSTFSAMAVSAILSHYGSPQVPIGTIRPLTNTTFFDDWSFELGEYTSKIAYHFSGGSIPWGHAEDAWDPVKLYRKVLAETEDASVTIVSIGFLDNLSALLNSTGDGYSHHTGRELVSQKVAELVVMGGAYPSGREWNFFGSSPSQTAHAINTWEGRVVFLGDEAGRDVFSGGRLMREGPATDIVRQAYIYYSYFKPRPSWDMLAVLYDGSNAWVWDESVTEQKFLRLKVDNKTAAAGIDRLLLKGSLSGIKGAGGGSSAPSCEGHLWHEEL